MGKVYYIGLDIHKKTISDRSNLNAWLISLRRGLRGL